MQLQQEACYLYKFNKERLNTGDIQGKAISSTILDLCLKRVISLRVEEKEVYVSILKENKNYQKMSNKFMIYYIIQVRIEKNFRYPT